MEKCDKDEMQVRFSNVTFKKKDERWAIVTPWGEELRPLLNLSGNNNSLDFLINWCLLPDPLMTLPKDGPEKHWTWYL